LAPGLEVLTWYEVLTLCMKLCTLLWHFVSRYEMLYLGRKICTKVWNIVPRYEMLYPDMKCCTLIWNVVPWYEMLYPDMKCCTQIWNAGEKILTPVLTYLSHNSDKRGSTSIYLSHRGTESTYVRPKDNNIKHTTVEVYFRLDFSTELFLDNQFK
jgi:hypothetical protein